MAEGLESRLRETQYEQAPQCLGAEKTENQSWHKRLGACNGTESPDGRTEQMLHGRSSGKVYRSKLDWIGRFLSPEKTVLDLGCVGNAFQQTAGSLWLHRFLRSRAKRVVGVDYLPDVIDQMCREGYDAVCADVQQLELNETFDVIVAGDIIEHLDNVGLFLDRCRNHLKPDGVLLVTTPNPVNPVRFAWLLLKGSVGANKEHTCWFTANVLRNLAQRHGLAAEDESYVDDTHLFYPWPKYGIARPKGSTVQRGLGHALRLLGMLLFWRPMLLAASLIGRVRVQTNETLCLALRKWTDTQPSADLGTQIRAGL